MEKNKRNALLGLDLSRDTLIENKGFSQSIDLIVNPETIYNYRKNKFIIHQLKASINWFLKYWLMSNCKVYYFIYFLLLENPKCQEKTFLQKFLSISKKSIFKLNHLSFSYFKPKNFFYVWNLTDFLENKKVKK